MQTHFNLNELNQFSGSEQLFQHWGNRKLAYTEGVQYFASKLKSYWLIDEIGCVILPRLLKEHRDYFYCIQLFVHNDCSAIIAVDDGNGNIYLNHKINWTDLPIVGETIKFYLCDSDGYHCLMLPSEY